MFNFKMSKVLAGLIISASVLMGCSPNTTVNDVPVNDTKYNQVISTTSNAYVHFIDTGNSDSILIEDNGEFMLIDGGDTDDDELVNNYLKSAGVTKLKYVLATHPHADHIGALDTVIKNFDVETLLLGSGTATTKTYESMILSAKEKGLKFTKPKDGEVYTLGEGILKFYNSNNDGDSNLNNASVITLYSHGEDDFLFTGDAEKEVELLYKDIIGDIEVLKVGHHGSSSSSSIEFLKATTPEYAVILTGENSYGHPHKEVMENLEDLGIEVFRSDESGDIVATSTGDGITFNTNSDSYTANGSSSSYEEEEVHEDNHDHEHDIVYFTPNGKSYHATKDCSALSRSKTILEGTLEEAIEQGKDDPCDFCYDE